MDHNLVVFSINRLFDERLLEHIATDHNTVIILLHILFRILKENI